MDERKKEALKGTNVSEGAVFGASVGAIVGGVLGLLVGVGTLIIPGVGLFTALGSVIATVIGIGAGAAIGGLAGTLVGIGVPETRYDDHQLKGAQGARSKRLRLHTKHRKTPPPSERDHYTDYF